MTRAEWLLTAASACLFAGLADVALLARWALPRALGLSAFPPANDVRVAATAWPASSAERTALPAVADRPTTVVSTVDTTPENDAMPSSVEPSSAPSVMLLFDTGSARLARGRAALKAIARAARTSPHASIEVDGHADQRGAERNNAMLSLRRARAVAAGLRQAGVSASRIVVRAYGSTSPHTHGDDETSWRLNRRVEVHVRGGGP